MEYGIKRRGGHDKKEIGVNEGIGQEGTERLWDGELSRMGGELCPAAAAVSIPPRGRASPAEEETEIQAEGLRGGSTVSTSFTIFQIVSLERG